MPKSGRETALYLLSGPQTNRIGIFYLSVATAAEDLKLGAETIRKGLADVCQTFAWHFDADARVFYIPSWWKWNSPENANVLVGNLKDLNEIPPCGLVTAFLQNVETLPETLHQTFLEHSARCSLRHSPNQEHLQEHFQKGEQEHGRAETARTVRTGKGNGLTRLVPQAILIAGKDADLDIQIDALLSIANQMGKQDYRRKDALEALAQSGIPGLSEMFGAERG